ncbi:unnamed protein product [Heligmosomoides polygyrus]|uniref:Exostosin domain-containing protein n=1 Tax=Heligmosomoides polygyrus TaxID=6339 RepID=A0A183FE92_HELPZ|nr:unnamed protein product [Heligmosomoides polygyrus]
MCEARLRWHGHVLRGEEDRVKIGLNFEVIGKLPGGRPKQRWSDTTGVSANDSTPPSQGAAAGNGWERTLFTHEELFTVEQAHDRRNDRIWSTQGPASSVIVKHCQNPKVIVMAESAVPFLWRKEQNFHDVKANYKTYLLFKILRMKEPKLLLQAYKSYVCPIVEFGITGEEHKAWCKGNSPDFIPLAKAVLFPGPLSDGSRRVVHFGGWSVNALIVLSDGGDAASIHPKTFGLRHVNIEGAAAKAFKPSVSGGVGGPERVAGSVGV